jgi:glyoxylase-like metal-dependent hydrolase (beta-lactamase superfamily II)
MKRAIGYVALLIGVGQVACGGESPPPDAPTVAAPEARPPTAAAAPTVPSETTTAAAPSAPKLTVRVVTGSPEGFLVNSTVIEGKTDAIVIDSQFTLADGKKLAEAVLATKKNLTFVYVTHYHPDHYFGFVALKEAFPNAKLVALPAVVADIQRTWAEKVKQWQPLYKSGITDKPVLPEALAGNTLELEGQKLEVVGPLQGDDTNNSYVWIPSLKTVVAGDIVYDGVFPWTAETTAETRQEWSASLDKVAAIGATSVIPGHQKLDKQHEPANVDFTKTYLKDFDSVVAASKSAADVQTKIKAKYPDVALDVVLKLGAEAAFAKQKPTKKKT